MNASIANLKEERETVLITGGSGLVGKVISEQLTNTGYQVIHLSRKKRNDKYPTYLWDIKAKTIQMEALEQADYIIHLAGAGVADQRWTNSWKREIISSRIDSTQLLYDAIHQNGIKIKKFVSASAIGYYGMDTKDQIVDETSSIGEGFLAGVVRDWENAVSQFDLLGIKTTMIRIGIVLDKAGGALEKMIKPINMGVGAPLASGNQYMSWIHIKDLSAIFEFALNADQDGIFNAVSPEPVSNKVFTKALANALKKPTFLPNVPAFVLKLMFGEMSSILIGGNRVSSNKIEKLGFNFQFPSLDSALADIIHE